MHYMSFAPDALQPFGLPTYGLTSDGSGRKVRIVGGAVSAGEIVRACTDDGEALLDASKAYGPTSGFRVCEKLTSGADATAYGRCGIFSIALEDIADDAEGLVADFGICYANVGITSADMVVGDPLMVDFATQRLLALTATANTKVVALLATDQTGTGGAVASRRVPVIFSGLFPLANVTNTTA